jgi:HEPN domain-containing protein/predicted nucleotidyltransferase
MAAHAQIDEMVRRIVERFQPDRIILFGSQARGDAGPDSDVDLLVIMPFEGTKWDKAAEISAAIGDLPLGTDIHVATPEEVERRRDIVGTIIRPALREGNVLYEDPQRKPDGTRAVPAPGVSMEEVAQVVREWIARAESDLRAAEAILTLPENCPYETVAFHAQQCAEKYLKAVLISRSIDFPRTHDPKRIQRLLPAEIAAPLSREQAEWLTKYAAQLRYPSKVPIRSRAEAEEAVRLARAVRDAMRQCLPPT